MTFNFVLSYLVVILLIWEFYRLIEWSLDKLAEKKYARNHFELTERYRNGLD